MRVGRWRPKWRSRRSAQVLSCFPALLRSDPIVRDLEPGDPAAIGPYRVTGRLGEGGMGQVYLAESRGGRRVAVKVVRPEIAADPNFRERFSREIHAAKAVGGFWTAPIVDADPDAATPWVASDYIAAPNLADRIAQHGAYPALAVRSLAAGLAEAVEAIHRVGLVHRDIKPGNILVTDDGLRVIDFGISKAVEGLTVLTTTGLVIGSPGFMSPEQAAGARVGPPSDIFSLGAVLVFAATGEGPFGQGSIPALLYRVVHNQPILDRVPAEIRNVLAACLEKTPERRPTAEELLDLLTGEATQNPTHQDHRRDPITPAAPTRTAPESSPGDARVSVMVEGDYEAGTIVGGIGFLLLVGTTAVGILSGEPPEYFLGALPAVLMTAFGYLKRRTALRHPRESVIEVTPRGLTFQHQRFEWAASWAEIQSVTLTRVEIPNGKAWLGVVTVTVQDSPNPRVPRRHRVKGEPTAVRNGVPFTDDATARAELSPMDATLRQYARERYQLDPVLSTLLHSPP
ncbi:serine/threonine-protein kinase [Streptomyces sp. NPDC005953]|uniref:serine/threonine-protein kinase n=1 Tax=Streptomyces sp. NPDC005953 TaxID=3156719 RepID=UPI00340C0F30